MDIKIFMKLLIIALSATLTLLGCSSSTENGFVNACMQSNSEEVCSCMYSELEAVYGEKGMQEIGLGDFPDNFEQTLDRLGQKQACM